MRVQETGLSGGMSSTLRRIGRLSGWKHINLTSDYTGRLQEIQAAITLRRPERVISFP